MSKAKTDYKKILASRKFDFSTPIVQDKIYFSIDKNVIGTSGNFITISGLPKAGKSRFIGAIIAAWLSDRPVFDFKMHRYQDKTKIALFDTEQGTYQFEKLIKFIKQNCKTENIYVDFDAYLLRQDNSQDIAILIDTYLKENKDCGVLIIDGILDLIDNMNDEGASKALIRRLKHWAVINDILIITVLHLGKKDLTSIGHVGSASDRYSQSTLLVEKTKDNKYTCASKYLRDAMDFETISIWFDPNVNEFIQIK